MATATAQRTAFYLRNPNPDVEPRNSEEAILDHLWTASHHIRRFNQVMLGEDLGKRTSLLVATAHARMKSCRELRSVERR